MAYKITILEFPDQPTLTMRETHPVEQLPTFFRKVFGGVVAYLNELGEQPSGMPFGIYYNLDMSALDVEAGFPVSGSLPGKGEVRVSVIPGGLFISTVHKGSYDSMEPAYDALSSWAKENDYKPTGVVYEYYLNDPNDGVMAETEIRFPVLANK